MIPIQPLEVGDFTGGITDKYIDADPSKAQTCDNLQITVNRKLITRPGSKILDASYPLVSTVGYRVGALISFDSDAALIAQYGKKLFVKSSTSWNEITGPSSNAVFSAGSASSVISHAQGLKHLIVANGDYAPITKVYKDGSGNWKARTAGLPELPSGPTVSMGSGGSNSYLYAFHYKYEYTVEDKTFVDFGPTYQTPQMSGKQDPGTSSASITSIPSVPTFTGHNYDIANIKVVVYRTINGGTVFFKVGEASPNGSGVFSTFTDSTSDANLLKNEPIYTTGDVLDYDPPPPAKYVHISANNTAYYANVKEGSEYAKSRVRQSVAYDFDSCPADFWVDLNSEIKGISSVRGRPIVFTTKGVYRIDGTFNELGQGGMIAEVIDDTVSCAGHNSIVQVLDGVVWCATDGVYYSDGYKVVKLSVELDDTFSSFIVNNPQNIVGTYDSVEQRVYWAIQRSASSGDNDALLVLDLRWGVKSQSTFTTWSGKASFKPSSILIYQRKLHRADSRGYVFKHAPADYSDPTVDILTSVSSWGVDPILWEYTTPAFQLGTIAARKWVTKMTAVFDTVTNISVQIQSINDASRKVSSLSEIRQRSVLYWGMPEVTWGDPDLVWNLRGALQYLRRMPAGSLRTSYKQLKFCNSFTNIINSDDLSTGTIVASAKTIQLTNGALTWPTAVVGYSIAFEHDGYVRNFPITARTSTTLTYEDSGGHTPPNGVYKWLIRGYAKNEVVNLQSYALYFGAFSDSIQNYTGKQGEVQ